MTDYTQLTDDELRRKVLELMGYSVEFETETYDYGGTISYYDLRLNGEDAFVVGDTEDEAWQQAPDPLNDANVYMGLVDEMRLLDMQVTVTVDNRQSSAVAETLYAEFIVAISSPKNPGRAICEVYCQVNEGE